MGVNEACGPRHFTLWHTAANMPTIPPSSVMPEGDEVRVFAQLGLYHPPWHFLVGALACIARIASIDMQQLLSRVLVLANNIAHGEWVAGCMLDIVSGSVLHIHHHTTIAP